MGQGMKTVGFMVIVSLAFMIVLATVNEATKPRVEKNFALEQAKSMLYAFNVFPSGVKEETMSPISVTANVPWKEADLVQAMQTRMRKVSVPIPATLQSELAGTFLAGKSSVELYEGLDEQGNVVSYGLFLYGKGLWGSIEGFGVISSDLKKMVGIDFLKQSETPGLGARITEKEYKYFYRNLDLGGFYEPNAGMTPVIMLKTKPQTNIDNSTNSVQAITGATQTSQGVLDMINSNLALYLKILQAYPHKNDNE